ncbi:RNA-processing protein [Candidatus Woesearchaeota archaeon]|nr:RNA-processing protein [Candidatus Woesearchaeota archaeon]
MAEFAYEIKIPKERIAVLIGKSGEIKKKIENTLGVKLQVDSQEGDITIQGEDALQLYSGRDIVRAIGRGFNPETALLLLKPDYVFELIDVTRYVKENHLQRMKGRIIGKDGKARLVLEELTLSSICVYGKSIGIIGETENVGMAKRALESLLQGAPHAVVYKWLEKRRKEMKTRI